MKRKIFLAVTFVGCLAFSASDIFAQCGLPGTPPCPASKKVTAPKKANPTKKTVAKTSSSSRNKSKIKTRAEDEQMAELVGNNQTIVIVKDTEAASKTNVTLNVASASGFLSPNELARMIDTFFSVLNGNPRLIGVILLYGTDKEVAIREADIRKFAAFRQYDLTWVHFERKGTDPGVMVEFYVVPPGGTPPTKLGE